MEEKITFGQFISKKRKEANLTQKEFAKKMNVTESAVSKWERGVSYPDISLVSAICSTLKISEHELITSSEDHAQRQVEKQARTWRNFVKTYAYTFYALYGISLLLCLVFNLVFEHTLSWFFIVLTAEMVAFSLTSLPVLLKSHRGVLALAAFFVTLNLLIFTCCVYSGEDWFFVAFISLLFGFSVVFLPFVLKDIPLPKAVRQHKALVCFTVDTILLFALIATVCAYENVFERFFTVAVPSALVGLVLPWIFMIAIRYIKANGFLRAAICLLFAGPYGLFINSVLNAIDYHRPIVLPAYNLQNWSSDYLNGNITLSLTIILLALATIFFVRGIVFKIKSKQMKPARRIPTNN